MQKMPLLFPFLGVCVLWLIQMGLWICYLLFSTMLSFLIYLILLYFHLFHLLFPPCSFLPLLYLLLCFLPWIPTPYLFPDIWEVFWIPRHIFLSYYISNFSWSSMACTSLKIYFSHLYVVDYCFICLSLCCCLFLVFSHYL